MRDNHGSTARRRGSYADVVMAAEASVSTGRRTLIEAVVGAFIGFAGWNFVGPKIISWWYQPPASEALSCSSSVDLALSQFVFTGLVITVISAVAAALLMFFVRRKLRARGERASGSTPA